MLRICLFGRLKLSDCRVSGFQTAGTLGEIGLKFVVKYKLGKNGTLDKGFLDDYYNNIWQSVIPSATQIILLLA
jgi:hypothetical protein